MTKRKRRKPKSKRRARRQAARPSRRPRRTSRKYAKSKRKRSRSRSRNGEIIRGVAFGGGGGGKRPATSGPRLPVGEMSAWERLQAKKLGFAKGVRPRGTAADYFAAAASVHGGGAQAARGAGLALRPDQKGAPLPRQASRRADVSGDWLLDASRKARVESIASALGLRQIGDSTWETTDADPRQKLTVHGEELYEVFGKFS